MVLNLHRSKQWMYCHVKDTILEHAREDIIMKLHYTECLIYFIHIIKALMIWLCPPLPPLYTLDQVV